MSILSKDIKFLPGVGPKRAEVLSKELDINTYKDLLYYFPYKYIDKSKIYKINEINNHISHIQLKGKIISFQLIGEYRKKRLVATFTDGTGMIELIWFQGIKWIQQNLHLHKEYLVFGRPTLFGNKFNIAHPEVEPAESMDQILQHPVHGQYSLTEKLKSHYINSKTITKLVNNLFQEIGGKIEETVPGWLIKDIGLMPLETALKNLHFPREQGSLEKAQFRIKYEELFYIQLQLLKQKYRIKTKSNGFIFEKVGALFHAFYQNNLPFELTNAQKRVVKEIRRDIGSGRQMNRLLQGDVGSGKTLVALLSMLITIDNGFQACLMAPTEILAQQHFLTIQKFLEGIDISTALLTGSTKAKERKVIREGLLDGRLNILVGTHALIEQEVEFGNLGMAVIDEQHRFGVAQRARLWKKNKQPPHILVMTATPIPRTLAMTLYGDLEVSVIDELPPGRKPIKTYHYYDNKRLALFGFIKKQINAGRQIYIVYPLIKESEKLDYKDLEDGYESIARAFPAPEYTVSVVHGRMKPEEKDTAMAHFKEGRADILVATSVIEVGVDVPNASVMVIESAERFGLSQLHQLRGRVGRGADQAYCILMTSYKLSKEGRQRIETMVRTNDGFEIAEADLQLRGPGDMEGTQQSGIAFNLKLANLARDNQILQYARNKAEEILEEDPELQKQENQLLQQVLETMRQRSFDWSRIS